MDIRNNEGRMAAALVRLANHSDIREANKKTIAAFIKARQAYSIKLSTRLKELEKFILVARFCDVDLETATRTDLERLIVALENGKKKGKTEPLSKNTIANAKQVLRLYYTWLNKSDDKADEVPPIISWMKVKMPRFEWIDSKDCITRRELANILSNVKTLKHKALYALTYETAGRISEILEMKIKDFSADGLFYKAKIGEHGKTFGREIPIIEETTIAYLKRYLELEHPDKNNQEALLFPEINYQNARYYYANAIKKSGVHKRANLHWLRHSRSSELSDQVGQKTFKYCGGWSQVSKMPERYTHAGYGDAKVQFEKLVSLSFEEKVHKLEQSSNELWDSLIKDPLFQQQVLEGIKRNNLEKQAQVFVEMFAATKNLNIQSGCGLNAPEIQEKGSRVNRKKKEATK